MVASVVFVLVKGRSRWRFVSGRERQSRKRDTGIGLATPAFATYSNRQLVPPQINQKYPQLRIEAATHLEGPVENSTSGGVAESDDQVNL